MNLIRFAVTGMVMAALPYAGLAQQNYPNRTIRMIVPFPAGGVADVLGRMTAQKLSAQYGQQMVVENRGGSGGHLGAEVAARATPDGYTIMFGTIGIHAAYGIYTRLSYDPSRDLQPVILLADLPNILVVHPSVPVKTTKEFIALAKAKPGQINYASSGIGSPGHLAAVLFESMAKIQITHIPYKGGGPAMIDLVGGQVQLVFATAASAIPQIKSGRIKGIAVTTLKRSALMLELPTIAESGLAGYDANNWYGVMVPAKTPRAIVMRLNKEIIKVLAMPDVKSILFSQGLDPAPTTPEAFGTYIKIERTKWAKVIKTAGIKAE